MNCDAEILRIKKQNELRFLKVRFISFWRREGDSNPRAIARKLISSQPRYDLFDISPYVWNTHNIDIIPHNFKKSIVKAKKFLIFIDFFSKIIYNAFVACNKNTNRKHNMRILVLGDIVGGITIDYLSKNLSRVTREHKIDFVIANGENASEIKGLSQSDAEDIFSLGVDFITLGNHAFGKRDLYSFLDTNDHRIVRPANFPSTTPGSGYSIVRVNGYKLLIINVLGTMYMTPLNSPFETVERILEREKGSYDFAILDIHAEATSEKLAIAHYFDGRIALMFGTHTHVQTADEQILPNGSAYITDIGMCGPVNSILGTKTDTIIESFTQRTPQYFTVAEGEVKIHGIIVDLDPDTSKIVLIKRFVF